MRAPRKPNPFRYRTVEAVAKRLGVPLWDLRHAINEGDVRAITFGGCWIPANEEARLVKIVELAGIDDPVEAARLAAEIEAIRNPPTPTPVAEPPPADPAPELAPEPSPNGPDGPDGLGRNGP